MNRNKPDMMSSPLQSVEIHFDPAGFGERLQKARKASGLTQEGLAEKLAVDRNHVSRMERGTRVCSIDLLVEIGKYEGQGAFLPLYPVCSVWQELLHAPLHALQDFVCVCPRKVTILADGSKRE